MEIRLAKIYDDFPHKEIKTEFFDLLTSERYEEFQKSISDIEELHSVRRLMDFVVINDRELVDFLKSSSQDLTNKSVSWNAVRKPDIEKVYLNVNRIFLNYLSSIRTFLDHSETFLAGKFEKHSFQFVEFKKITSIFYDNSFAYRFFYKLRNYSQHIGMPIDNIEFSTKYNREENVISGALEIKFGRDHLLSNYASWGSVKVDLENMSERFDLAPLLFEMTYNIREIERNIELFHKDALIKAADFITDLTKHLQDGKGEVFIACNFKEKENKELASYSSVHIPFDTIDFIKREFSL